MIDQALPSQVKVKDTTVYKYTLDVLDYTTTYKAGTKDSKDGLTIIKSMTDYSGNTRGEEVTNFTYNYAASLANVSTTTVYFYGIKWFRFTTLLTEAIPPMSVASTYSGEKSSALYGTTDATLKTRTHYMGDKGEELADYSQSFMKNRFGAVVVKDTTIYSYGTGPMADVLDYTTTYRDGMKNVRDTAGLAMKSYTDYVGDIKGEEVSNYTYNYNAGASREYTATTTVYFYGTLHERAGTAAVRGNTPMTASSVYYGTHSGSSVVYNVTAMSSRTDLKSRTHYFGYKGEELVDYSQNFMKGSIRFVQVRGDPISSYSEDILTNIYNYKGGALDVRGYGPYQEEHDQLRRHGKG